MEMVFRECVSEAKERGQTVFLSSHILSEVEALCDRVGILRAGRLVDEGTLAELRHLERADGRGHVRRAGAGAARARGRERRAAPVPTALRFEVAGSIGPLIAALAEAAGRDAHQPRAVARGDLPAPLRPWRRSRRRRSGAGTRRAAVARRRRAIARRALPRRARAHDRLRATCSRCRLHPAGRLPPRLPDARGSRLAFAHSFADNKAVVLFYGKPYDLLTVGGYSAWRVGGTLAIFAAVFGLLAAVRALRTEEDAGRIELVLAGRRRRGAGVTSAVDGGDRRRASLLLWARGVRRARSSAGCRWAARRTWRWRRSRSSRCSSASARSRASSRRRAGSRSSSAAAWSLCSLRAARDRRHVERRSAGCAGRRRWAGPRSCGRSPALSPLVLLLRVVATAAAADHRRGGSRPRRDVGTGLLPARDTRRAAAASAVLADRTGAAQRARQPDRLALQRRRVRVHRRRDLEEHLLGRDLEAARARDREARRRARS